MADESTTNPGGEGNQPDPSAVAAEEARKAAEALSARRKDFLTRQSLKAQQDAVRQGGGGDGGGGDAGGDEIDLSGVDPAIAAKIRLAMDDRKKVRGVVSDALKFGMEQGRKAKAHEIASELAIEKEQIPELIAALSNARTPEELDLRAKELVIEFKSDGTLASVVKPAAEKKEGETPEGERKFDTGRSTSANRTSALLEKIDQIDPADPKAQEKLDALKKEVDAAQARATARR